MVLGEEARGMRPQAERHLDEATERICFSEARA